MPHWLLRLPNRCRAPGRMPRNSINRPRLPCQRLQEPGARRHRARARCLAQPGRVAGDQAGLPTPGAVDPWRSHRGRKSRRRRRPRACQGGKQEGTQKAGPNATQVLHIGTKADVLPANMVREQFGKQIGENCVVIRVLISNPAARPLSLDPPIVSAEGKPYGLKTVSDRSKVKKGVLWLPTSTVPADGEVEAHVFFDKKRFASPDQPSYSFRVEGTLLQP